MAKELPRFTRREFLKGIAALVLLGGCKPEKTPSPAQSPSPQPTPEPIKTPLKAPTIKEATTIPTPEPTPTKEEVLNIPSVVINEELLKKAFAGIGGGEALANGQGEETTLISFGHDYVFQAWGKEIDFKNLSEDPVASLQYIVSLGSYQGTEGIFSPGKRGEETIFPQLADLSFPRLTLDNVLSKAEQEGEEYQKYVSPQNFEPREGTQMVVIGLFNEPQLETGIIIDKDALGGELNYALVAFTDYLRVSEEGIPRHYFAILPTHFPADPENKNTLTLKNLLEANGYQYDHQTQQITFDSDNGQTVLALNQIKGEELIQEIRQAVGLYSVDQVGGKLVNNPIVPYYKEMPAVWEVEETKDEEGNITSLLLKGQDQEGEMTNVAQARYDWEEDGWQWEEIVTSEQILARAPKLEGLAVFQEDGRIVYRAEANNPYGLEVGEYAGYLFEFDDETGISSGRGIALAKEVRRKLLEQANTPEAIEKGEWRMTFNFDPKGERIRVWHFGRLVDNIAISGLPTEVKFRSPFVEQVLAKWYLSKTSHSVGIFVPESLLKKSERGINYGIQFSYVLEGTVNVDNFGRKVGFDEVLFTNISKENLPSPPYSAGSQLAICGGSLRGPVNFPLSRILMVDKSPVFSLDK